MSVESLVSQMPAAPDTARTPNERPAHCKVLHPGIEIAALDWNHVPDQAGSDARARHLGASRRPCNPAPPSQERNRMRFQDRKIVITGAAGVYGRELAAAFAAEGATLFLTDRDAGTLAAPPGLPAHRATLHAADLTRDTELEALIAASLSGGVPDVLINNAGIYPFIPLAEVTPAEFDRIQSINVRAPFRLMQGIGGAMARAGRGSIVNVSSTAAEVIRGNGVPYGASKASLEYVSRAFALEYGPAGVRVNCARPGFAEGSAEVTMPAGYAEAITARGLLRRAIRPGEFAAAVLFLCSDAAGFITGTMLDSSGGGAINRRGGASTRAR
jgi:3-oxoacyl-[acyl-carrier protein] reductase